MITAEHPTDTAPAGPPLVTLYLSGTMPATIATPANGSYTLIEGREGGVWEYFDGDVSIVLQRHPDNPRHRLLKLSAKADGEGEPAMVDAFIDVSGKAADEAGELRSIDPAFSGRLAVLTA